VKERNLIFASASIHPQRTNISFNKKEILRREEDYLFCLKQLYRVTPKNFDIYIVDNSLENSNSLYNEDLKLFLDKVNIFYTKKSTSKKIKNIGVQELKQLFYLEQAIDFKSYNKVCYLTARRFVTNPYVFEKTNKLSKEALLSNPDFIYLDGEIVLTEKKGMFNDMFFAMKTETIINFIKFSKKQVDYMDKNMVSSENNLYNFITEQNIDYDYLEFLGFLRYDYYRKNIGEIKHNYHFV
tara:strand:+ start:2199 stop:2918 length:720 start_codon:yes stop_codon:yes gene_type:complete